MSGKEIVEAMIRGLEKEHVKVLMSTFGHVDDYGVCVGCAATNIICEILGFVPNLVSVIERLDSIDKNHSFVRWFEMAIDQLRQGNIKNYNVLAESIGIARLPIKLLPQLTTANYKEKLIYYKEYAKTLK